MTPDEIREQLREAGARLATADANRKQAIDDIATALRQGHGSLEIKEMSELAGVSRVTAHRLIGKGES